jgi:hypothetical protein
MLDEHKPDRPPTTHWQYRPDRVYINEPAAPGLYPAFNESDAF